jgi:hypothetical protein
LTARRLERAAVPHPLTAWVREGEEPPIPPPIVFKPRFGSWGRGSEYSLPNGDVYRDLARALQLPTAANAARTTDVGLAQA